MASMEGVNERYEKRAKLGEGGMGVVWRVYDVRERREVALKTIRNAQDRGALELFRKECDVLKRLSHPNIVDIFEVGETEVDGSRQPFFVMPLLRGQTLDKLIASSTGRLTVKRCVDILLQVCRGLQAAHDNGLIHRDLKPGNLFILEDDSVKIIDFGVAHLVDTLSTAGIKGTLSYMAPEVMLRQKPTALSDLFSLGVVSFEMLTRRRPFDADAPEAVQYAILKQPPPPASQFNSNVGLAISQIVHKAMAKQPYQRFASVKEFGEYLQKAFHNEPLELFSPSRVEPRMQRVKRALESGELTMADDILSELESEAMLHPELSMLRKQADLAIRNRTVQQLMETARRLFEEEEYQLALQKLQEVLNLDSSNTDAHALKAEIEGKRSAHQIEDWLRLAWQHLENHAYGHAREALDNVFQLRPNETKARHLLVEVGRREEEYVRLRQEKEQLYQAAVDSAHRGELSSALTMLERVLEMDHRAPDTLSPDQAGIYQNLYDGVRSEHDRLMSSFQEARKHSENKNFAPALEICRGYLERYPDHALFRSLLFDVEDRQRQEMSAFVARVDREVNAEADLNQKLRILEEALRQCKDEPHFQRALETIRKKREFVESIVSRARLHEEQGQYSESLGQWEIVRNVYPQYPALEFEVERLQKRKGQKDRSEAKTRWIGQIEGVRSVGDFSRAIELCAAALAEHPGDPELVALESATKQSIQRSAEAQRLLAEAESRISAGDKRGALESLLTAKNLDPNNSAVRGSLVGLLLGEARELIGHDWREAERYLQPALDIEPENPLAKSLRTLVQDRKQEEFVTRALSQARELQIGGDLTGAVRVLDQALALYPGDQRLAELRAALKQILLQSEEAEKRRNDLKSVRDLERQSESEPDQTALQRIFQQAGSIAARYSGDAEFEAVVQAIRKRAASRAETPIPQPSPPTVPVKEVPPLISRSNGPGVGKSRQWVIGTVATAAFLMLIGGVAGLLMKQRGGGPEPVSVVKRPVVLADPGDAIVHIYDKSMREAGMGDLPAGDYLVKATRRGYEPAEQPVTLVAPGPQTVILKLQPILPVVQVFSELEGIKVMLDGQVPPDAGPGNPRVNRIADGEHTLNIAVGGAGIALTFRAKAGAPAEVTQFKADRLRSIAVDTFDGSARFHAPQPQSEKASVAFQDSPPVEIGPNGLAREGLRAGLQTVTLHYGADKRDLPLDIAAGPMLYVFLLKATAPDTGALLVDVGLTDVRLRANGNEVRYNILRGSQLYVSLPPGKTKINIDRDGYEPLEREINIQKGQTERLESPLVALPQLANLAVENGLGAQIEIDKSGPWQDAGRDGKFQLKVTPGQHVVRIRKKGFREQEQLLFFTLGLTTTLDIAKLKFQKLSHAIMFRVTPANAEVTVKGTGINVRTGNLSTLDLPEGTYAASAGAVGHEASETAFEVAGPRTVSIELNPIAGKAAKQKEASKPEIREMAGWDSAAQWKQDVGGSYTRESDRLTLFRTGGGTFTFETPCARGGAFLGLKGGGCRTDVYVNYMDGRNFIKFEVTKDKITRKVRRDGVETTVGRNHGVKLDGGMKLQITVTAGTAIIELDGAKIETYENATVDLRKGRFGLERVKTINDFRHSGN